MTVECPDCGFRTMLHSEETIECPHCGDRLYPEDVVDLIREDRGEHREHYRTARHVANDAEVTIHPRLDDVVVKVTYTATVSSGLSFDETDEEAAIAREAVGERMKRLARRAGDDILFRPENSVEVQGMGEANNGP